MGGTFVGHRFSEGSGLLHHEQRVDDFDYLLAEFAIDRC